MTTHEFKGSSYDSCICFKKSDYGSFVYLFWYIYDILIAIKDERENEEWWEHNSVKTYEQQKRYLKWRFRDRERENYT